ncbi:MULTISPECIES: RDD family protein [Pseudomonas]|uniref:RDD family protein n=1 Tax=Pseudomonas TaxID=286 RepID=UPI0025799332|nr:MULTISPECIES: RDD family protein [Pseudomonas]
MPSTAVSQALPAPRTAPLDTRLRIETPEGIDLILRPAGLVPRALAFAIDLAVRGLILGVMFVPLFTLGQFGMGLGAILMFLVTWWYMVLFEVFNQGRTPGKQIIGLRVVHDDGTPVGWGASLTRNLLRFADILPFGYTLGILSCLNSRGFKRLGDIAAGTLVIYRERPAERPPLAAAEPLRAPFAMSLEEQRALLEFAERQGGLSAARRAELAAILAEPLGVSPQEAEARINGIAHGLLGSA